MQGPPVSPSTADALRAAIVAELPDATVEVGVNGGGHFTLAVSSSSFKGRSMLDSHRLVYAAIAPLLAGADAPVHAIDTLRTVGR
jgi:stress-induced morphogen